MEGLKAADSKRGLADAAAPETSFPSENTHGASLWAA